MFLINYLKESYRTRNIVPLITITFSGFVLLVLFLSFNYGYYLNQLDTVISENEVESRKMRLNSELMELARSRTRLTSQIIDTEDPFDQDELNQQLDIYASRFALLRTRLLEIELNAEEKAILDKQPKIVAVILPAQRQAVELAMSDNKENIKKAQELLYDIVIPGQGEMVDSFAKLIELEQVRISELSESSHKSLHVMKQRSYLIIGGILTAIILLSIIVVFRVHKIQADLLNSHKNLEKIVNKRTGELRNAQSMLQNVLNTIPVRVFWKDPDGIFLGSNSLFAQDAGCDSPGELIGKNDNDMPWADLAEQYQSDDQAVMKTGKAKLNFNEPQIDAQGNTTWLETSKAPILNDQGLCVGVLGTYHDITDRKIAEEDLKEAIAAAEAASIEKSQFLATMSHEIRTPMNGVLGMAEILSNTQLNQNQQEYVHTILNSGELLLTILNDILDFSKLEAGKVKLEHIPFDLEWLSHDVMQILLPQINKKDIEFIFDYPLDIPRFFVGDPARLRQILFNLVGNAIKFTEHGYIHLSVRCTAGKNNNTILNINIEDTGIGISDDQAANLFNSFTQADSSTTRKYGGTGLGLAISEELTELMNGEISVDSEKGKGSTFTVQVELPGTTSPTDTQTIDLTGTNVLLLESNPLNSKVLEDMLAYLGASFEIAKNTNEVFSLLKSAADDNQPFNIAIVDEKQLGEQYIDLGQIAGYGSGTDKLPLIVTSSSTQHGDIKKYEQAGYSAFLTKPVRSDIIKSTITTLLDPAYQKTEIITHHNLPGKEHDKSASHRFEGKILLVEDTEVNQKVAIGMLNKLGLAVDLAEDGEQALNFWRRNDYDLIFMDCRMPTMDGYEATRIIRLEEQKNNRIPIIALTANVTEEDQNKCHSVGMDEVLTKPFKESDLVSSLSKWLTQTPTPVTDTPELTDINNVNTAESCIDISVFNNIKGILKDNFAALITAFYTGVDECISGIENWTDGDTKEELIRFPHSIKSSSANVGAMNLSKIAAECESLFRQDQQEEAMNVFTDLKQEYIRVINELESMGYEYNN